MCGGGGGGGGETAAGGPVAEGLKGRLHLSLRELEPLVVQGECGGEERRDNAGTAICETAEGWGGERVRGQGTLARSVLVGGDGEEEPGGSLGLGLGWAMGGVQALFRVFGRGRLLPNLLLGVRICCPPTLPDERIQRRSSSGRYVFISISISISISIKPALSVSVSVTKFGSIKQASKQAVRTSTRRALGVDDHDLLMHPTRRDDEFRHSGIPKRYPNDTQTIPRPSLPIPTLRNRNSRRPPRRPTRQFRTLPCPTLPSPVRSRLTALRLSRQP
jgi:hypothetical protein